MTFMMNKWWPNPLKKTWQFSTSPKSSESSLPILRDDYQSIDRSLKNYIPMMFGFSFWDGWPDQILPCVWHLIYVTDGWFLVLLCIFCWYSPLYTNQCHPHLEAPSQFPFFVVCPICGLQLGLLTSCDLWDDPPNSDQQRLSLRQARRLAVPLPVGHTWVCWKDMQNLAIFPRGGSVNDGGLGFSISFC